ncbi:hypothetical protein ACQZV8_02170, partial [Magnetococcales bacterium HHB-1]
MFPWHLFQHPVTTLKIIPWLIKRYPCHCQVALFFMFSTLYLALFHQLAFIALLFLIFLLYHRWSIRCPKVEQGFGEIRAMLPTSQLTLFAEQKELSAKDYVDVLMKQLGQGLFLFITLFRLIIILPIFFLMDHPPGKTALNWDQTLIDLSDHIIFSQNSVIHFLFLGDATTVQNKILSGDLFYRFFWNLFFVTNALMILCLIFFSAYLSSFASADLKLCHRFTRLFPSEDHDNIDKNMMAELAYLIAGLPLIFILLFSIYTP